MKEYKIKLTKEDYLRWYLFKSEIEGTFGQRLRRGRLTLFLMMLATGLLMYNDLPPFIIYIIAGLGVAILLLYGYIQKWNFKKFFSKEVDKRLSSVIGTETTLSLDQDSIKVNDATSKSSVKISEVETIYEIPQNLFIRFRSGSTMVIPADMADYDSLRSELISIVQSGSDIKFIAMPQWKW